MSKSEKQNLVGEEDISGVDETAESAENIGKNEKNSVDIEIMNNDPDQDDDNPSEQVADEYQTELEKVTLLLEDARAKAERMKTEV